MRIGMVLKKEFPPDIRVEKELRALVAGGAEVSLLCAGPPGTTDDPDSYEGLFIRRIGQTRRTLSTRLNYLRYFFTFHDEFWKREIVRFVRDRRIDVLHVHDLPIAGTALRAGKETGIPVVLDLHENYPALMDLRPRARRGALDRFWWTLERWYRYEERAVRSAAHVIVVVDEAKQRLLEAYGLPEAAITVVMNVEDAHEFQRTSEGKLPGGEAGEGDWVICYVGGGGVHRGLDTAVRAMQHLKADAPDCRLRIIGIKGSEAEELASLARSCGVGDKVDILGWQPFERVPELISEARVCLVPHHRNAHTDSTIPHKLFQYMLLEKPVVVSSCRPLQRIVEETGAGLPFEAGNPADLAAQIRRLHADGALCAAAGSRGRTAALDRYNWEAEGRKLAPLYDRISGRKH